MAKRSNNLTGRRSSSRNMKPYDANNSFVKKMATKVTDFIPQKSWISKWFNTSQDNGSALNNAENSEEMEPEEDTIQKPPPSKRPCIRMDVTHPPGTFSIQPRIKTSHSKTEFTKEQYSIHNETNEDFLEPNTAGPSGMGRLISSTPAVQSNVRAMASERSELNSLVSAPNNGTTNGMDDNSESSESTSGCSSLIPQTNRQEAPTNVTYNSSFPNRKRFINEKSTFSNHLQSPRLLLLDNSSRDSLSNRRPSFNPSVMMNTLDRASPLSSPFYSGNITFGGANAAGLYKRSRSLFNSSNELSLKVPKRTGVQVKPSNAAGIDSSGMSQTAKKILEALEHFSSPISDAKKIPLKSTNNSVSPSLSKKRAREEISSPTPRVGLRHLTRDLTVPTMPDIIKLRRRQKLQDTTVAARKIISAINEQQQPALEYCLRSEDDENSKYHGKVKTKTKTNLIEEETVKTVNLPNIPLPISSLPSFNFALPQPQATAEKSATKKENTFTFANPIKVTDSAKNLKSINNFTFSKPINAESKQVLSEAGNLPSKAIESNTPSTFFAPMQNFIWAGSSTAPRLKEKSKSKDIPVADTLVVHELKSGSVVDVLCKSKAENEASSKITSPNAEKHSDKKNNEKECNIECHINLKPTNSPVRSASVWECSECLIKNSNSEIRCTACMASKPTCKNNNTLQVSPPSSSISSEPKFSAQDYFTSQSRAANQWECLLCHGKNKEADVKCTFCGTSKTTQKPDNITTSNAATAQTTNLMDKFKPVEGSWECPGCMLRNSTTVITCPCCNASKPSSLKVCPKKSKDSAAPLLETKAIIVDSKESKVSQSTNSDIMSKFKPNKDSWECQSCMVRNSKSVTTCCCCGTLKSNAVEEAKTTAPLPTNGFGDKFKKPEGSWCCDSCFVINEAKAIQCVACGVSKPGSEKPATSSVNTSSRLQFNFGVNTTAGFKFGIDKADNQQITDNASSTSGFKFPETQQSNQTSPFTFGVPKYTAKDTNETNKTVSESTTSKTENVNGFKFTEKKSESIPEKPTEQKETAPASLFSFGVPTQKSEAPTVSTEKPVAATSTAPTFTFGIQKPEVTPVLVKDIKEAPFAATETSKTSIVTTTATISSTNTPLMTTIVSSVQKPASIFSFGVPSTTAAVSSTSVTRSSTCLPSFSQPSFVFPDAKTPQGVTAPAPAPAPTPTFGQILPPTSTANLSTTFSFGASKVGETAASNLPDKPVGLSAEAPASSLFPSTTISKFPMFNDNTMKTLPNFAREESKQVFSTSGSKPAFSIPENKVPAFGAPENKPSVFGSTETKMPVFGAEDKPMSVFNPPTLFESSAPAPVFGNTSSMFGTTATPNIFSTTKASEGNTSTSSLFTFGASNQTAPQPGNGFNFSANTGSTTAVQKPLFTFGSSSTTPQNNNLFGSTTFNASAPSSNTGFSFNAPKPEASAFGQPAAATPIFGAAQSSTQNQATPSFSSTPASNTGFNFGPTAPAAAASGSFNFGGMSSFPTPSGGFNFNPTNSTPAVCFDPNTRPSFNFTGGSTPPTFNAQPQSTSFPQRKIKKATRRMR